MSWHELPGGGAFCYGDRATYEAAIRAAPPNTMIKMGDLEPKALVECSTCKAKMEPEAARFHAHPKECGTCHEGFDENRKEHRPRLESRHAGAGTVNTAVGCDHHCLACGRKVATDAQTCGCGAIL